MMTDDYIIDFTAHAETFAGLPIVVFDPEKPLPGPDKAVLIECTPYENDDSNVRKFFDLPELDSISALVTGCYESIKDTYIKPLLKNADKLVNLRYLFIGDVTREEYEISWLEMCDMSKLWSAFPNLEVLQIRGSNELSLGKLALPHLKSLVLQSGGLPAAVVKEVLNADLPNLEHLELWLGVEEYGCDCTLNDLDPLMTGKLFPNLKYLGLCNSEFQDDICRAVADSPILDRIETLDLSTGSLTDIGAEYLFNSNRIKTLKNLLIHYHYMTDEWINKLQQLPCNVVITDQQEPYIYEEGTEDEEIWRYPSVTE